MNVKEFITTHQLNPENFRGAWSFAGSEFPKMEDELAQLVLEGKKTATASALADYEADDPLPTVDGKYDIVLNSHGEAVCAIQTTKVYIVKFDEVTAEHAKKEGEGLEIWGTSKVTGKMDEIRVNREALAYWRKAHQDFFTRFNLFSPDMDIVCEEFKLIS